VPCTVSVDSLLNGVAPPHVRSNHVTQNAKRQRAIEVSIWLLRGRVEQEVNLRGNQAESQCSDGRKRKDRLLRKVRSERNM
jgi:hypothetical protein